MATPTLITYGQIAKVFPKIEQSIVGALNETMNRFNINTERRIASFLAQCGHESVSFRRFEENLNYSAQGLVATFPKYFPSLSVAQPYHRQPAKIANKVYANRMGNGAPATGDGYMLHVSRSRCHPAYRQGQLQPLRS
jgi:predicted chitinase